LGESSGYDFVAEQDNGMARVQVKPTTFRDGNGYSCAMKEGNGPYKKPSFEFMAASVIPEDVWFIIPENKMRGQWGVALYPNLENSKYGLRGKLPGTIARIETCAEEYFPEQP
jgi:hypothetical protein